VTISVALCTYNGARYLPEQLASIAAQARRPDELVVCDDRSSDHTVEIVQAFAASAPFPVRLTVNPETLGSTRNFARAIQLCAGDLIALADQDDVWLPRKLAVLEQALQTDERVALVFSDAEVVDQTQQLLGYSLWQAIGFTRGQQRRACREGMFELLLRSYPVTGATAMFRSRYRDLLLPIEPGWVHDGWIALLLAAVADCRPVAQPLIRYRQHVRQQIGGERRNLYRRYRIARTLTQDSYGKVARAFEAARARLAASSYPVESAKLAALDAKAAHFQVRARMRQAEARRLPLVVSEMITGRYHRYSLGWKSIAQDLLR